MEQIFKFISFNTEIGLKVLFTIAFLIVLWLLRRVANAFIRESIRDRALWADLVLGRARAKSIDSRAFDFGVSSSSAKLT